MLVMYEASYDIYHVKPYSFFSIEIQCFFNYKLIII